MDILTQISDETSKSWTLSAKYCYKIGCVCSKCELAKELESLRNNNCYMKVVVLQLVKKFGKPK